MTKHTQLETTYAVSTDFGTLRRLYGRIKQNYSGMVGVEGEWPNIGGFEIIGLGRDGKDIMGSIAQIDSLYPNLKNIRFGVHSRTSSSDLVDWGVKRLMLQMADKYTVDPIKLLCKLPDERISYVLVHDPWVAKNYALIEKFGKDFKRPLVIENGDLPHKPSGCDPLINTLNYWENLTRMGV